MAVHLQSHGSLDEGDSDLIRFLTYLVAALQTVTLTNSDAVIGQKEGGRKLETLERANLFAVPLDDKCQWYRYDHLFAEIGHHCGC